MLDLKTRIKRQANEIGFELVGVAPSGPADTFDHFRDWLDRGYSGEMAYMGRHAEARRHPASILPQVRSVVMVGLNYHIRLSSPPSKSKGRVARYALGIDYHGVLRRKLKRLLAWIKQEVPDCWGRVVVDTAPLLERDFARRAGLGWFGKNTMLLNKKLGSYFFLGALLLDIDLPPDAPHEADHCGTCTACLDACPTHAFTEPGVLDSRLCLSYLTIELRGPVPEKLRGAFDEWLFGCDVCQEVCPWNRKAPLGQDFDLASRADLLALDLIEVLSLSEEDFQEKFKGTSLTRTRRSGLVRNAALILGNRKDPAALPALERVAADPDPVIHEAVMWAISRIRETGEHGAKV